MTPLSDRNKQQAIAGYQSYLNELKDAMIKEPSRLTLNINLEGFLMFINMQMQDPHTAAVVVPEAMRDKVGRYGNYFYAKGVMEWPF